MRLPDLARSPLLSAFLFLICSSGGLAAQVETGSLQVRVVSGVDGRPLAGAQVTLGHGMVGLTDEAGVALFDDLRPGTRVVAAQFLGHANGRTQVTLSRNRVSTVRLELAPRPIALAEVEVEARATRLTHTGFYRRRASGQGVYFTREEIVATRARVLSDVMRRVPGASVHRSRSTLSTPLFRGGQANCPVQYYVDGVQTFNLMIDELGVDDVEGLEIYRGAATLPAQFNRGSAVCGVIVVWTRDGQR